jgi:hypothetical protein
MCKPHPYLMGNTLLTITQANRLALIKDITAVHFGNHRKIVNTQYGREFE